MLEDYFFEINEEYKCDRFLVLIIYDIENDKKRNKLSKLLMGYGFRIQKSAFETMVTGKKYDKLVHILSKFVDEKDNDSIRIYKIGSKDKVIRYGMDASVEMDDVTIL